MKHIAPSSRKRPKLEQLVTDNVHFVHHVIRTCYPSARLGKGFFGAEYEDLIQIGLIGLTKAARTWDPARAKFTTHAYWQIRAALSLGLRSYGYDANKPGRTMIRRPVHPTLTDLTAGSDTSKHAIGDPLQIPATPPSDMQDLEAQETLASALAQARCLHSERDIRIFELHFLAGMTFLSIGKRYRFTRARAQQVVAHVANTLRMHRGMQAWADRVL